MKNFLDNWDRNYAESLKQIALFDTNQTSQWSLEQKQLFIKLLYHQRGHFADLLWRVGNFASDQKTKEVILTNIREEFGGHAPSHEELYLNFAKSHGVDLTYELLEERWYLPFLKEYIHGILRWLIENDANHRIIAFAAIERLDNLDYPALRDVAVSFGTLKKELIFFNVHVHATHYDNTEASGFPDLWNTQPSLIRDVFNFVADYQLDIWKKMSDYVFAYRKETQVVLETS